MTLVKWKVATRPDMTMYVVREKLAGPAAILDRKNADFSKKSFDGTAIYDNIYISYIKSLKRGRKRP